MEKVQDSNLTGPALEHAFLSAIGVPLVGSPNGPFAVFDCGGNRLLVFGEHAERIERKSLDDDVSQMPLSIVRKLGASFAVEDNTVVCTIDSVKAIGDSYSQAAMRAVVAKFKLATVAKDSTA